MDSSEGQANRGSSTASGAISGDGRFVVFQSVAPNLVPGDTNGTPDIFLRDRVNGTTERVSVTSAEGQGFGSSIEPVISADGKFVAFASNAALVPEDTNFDFDMFVRDRVAGTTERVSVSSAGAQAYTSGGPAISATGRFVTFLSRASNLVAGDTNGRPDFFIRDRLTSTTERVSVNTNEEQVETEGTQGYAPVSADGNFIAFSSSAPNLAPEGDSNGTLDVFVRDRQAGTTERVSVSDTGVEANEFSDTQAMTPDGRFVVFVSGASNLLAGGDGNGTYDGFIRDRQAGTTERVSVSDSEDEANGGSARAAISSDGRFVGFASYASNLVVGDANAEEDVFIRDRQNGTTQLISSSTEEVQGNASSSSPAVTDDGESVSFTSVASNLVAGDTNGEADVFVKTGGPPPPPPNAHPDEPIGLAQFETDGVTAIPTGRTTDGKSVVLKATLSDPDGDEVRLEVEVKPLGTAFDGNAIVQSQSVGSGSTAQATVSGLARALGYHWQARAMDEAGATSDWVSFGGNAETAVDFSVEAPIVFSSGNGNAQDIWLMNPDGTGLTRLTTNPGFDGAPSLSPDGTKIAYMSRPTTGGSNNDIWVMNVDGSQKTQLTTNPGTDERPTWSGDGTRIAFSSIRTTFSNTADIWSMKADGSDLLRLTTANGSDAYPAWSRDGTKIAFSSVRDGNEEIFLMNPNGTGQTQLTFTKGSVRNTTPTLSPTVSMMAQTAFVTRSGTRLLLNGKPFRFTGINIYNANSQGLCWYNLRSGAALDDALTAIGPGHEVIRAWFFQPLAITSGQRDWSAFDHTLAVAGAHGMKVVPTLTDQYGECGDGGVNGFKPKEWYQTGYKEVDPANLVSYRDWVAEVVTRYKDDPRIAFWQLVNEAEVTEVVGGVRQPCPQGTDEPADILKAWATDVSGLVKSIDQNHLVSLGTIGSGQCGAQGPQYQSVHDISTIDLCEYHDYGSPNVPMPGDQFNGLQVRINQCNALNKPLVVGEAGIIPNDVGGTFPKRAAAFEAKIGAQFAAGIQGFLAWDWSSLGSTLDNYDIGPGDPALEALIGPSALSVAFSSNRSSNNWEIYRLAAESPATVTRLTTRSQSDLAPSWSRDGRRIVFASGNPNGTGYDIWRMLSEGSNQLRLTTTTPNDNAPNW